MMFRVLTTSLVVLLCAALPASSRAAADDSQLVGLWQENRDGYKVVWAIGYWNGKWSVSAALHKSGEKPASWSGTEARVADGKLTFTRKRGVNAPASVMEDTKVTVQVVKDGELSYSTGNGGVQTLTRTVEVALAPDALPSADGKTVVADNGKPKPDLVKPKDGDVPPVKPADKPGMKPAEKPPEDAKKYAGMWLSDKEGDGYKTVWTIKIGADEATVSCTCFDPQHKKPTCYITGDKVQFEDGKLVFNQKMSANCPRHWFRNVKTTVEADKDTLAYSYFGGNGSLIRLSAATVEAGFIGTWANEIDGLTEVVIIKKVGTRWRVGANLLRGERTVSGWTGLNVKFADGKLTFTQKLRPGAPAGWVDKSQFTLEWDGDSLICNWVNGDKKGEPRALKLLVK
jgi:hypothetical protein